MPASKFTRKATTPARRRQWDHVYQSAKASGKSAATAVREANAALRDHPTRKRK